MSQHSNGVPAALLFLRIEATPDLLVVTPMPFPQHDSTSPPSGQPLVFDQRVPGSTFHEKKTGTPCRIRRPLIEERLLQDRATMARFTAIPFVVVLPLMRWGRGHSYSILDRVVFAAYTIWIRSPSLED